MNGRKAKQIRKAAGIKKKGSKYKSVPLLDDDGNQVMGTIVRGKEVIEYPRYTAQLVDDVEMSEDSFPTDVFSSFQVRQYKQMKKDYVKGIITPEQLKVMSDLEPNGE